MLNQKKLRVLDANVLYLIGTILFLTLGAYFQSKNLNIGLLITEYIIILLPPIIYIKAKKLSLKKTLRINKISIKHGLLVVLITILTYPAAVFGNALLMTILSLVGNLNIPQLPTATNNSEYLLYIFIISISAGICEEVFFRGFVLSAYERIGKKGAIILSAILFGAFHYNLYNLIGPIVLGLVFGYLVIITDSIFAGIIGHIVNNGFAVTLGFLLNLASDILSDVGSVSEAATEIPTTIAMISSTIVFGIISIITVFIAYKLVNIIKNDIAKTKSEKAKEIYDENEESKVKAVEYIPLIFTGVFFIIVSIMQLKEIISLG